MGDCRPPRPYAGAAPPTQQYNTAPTPIIAENPLIYKGACVCIYAVWGFHIPHRFLFASMGTPSGGREGEYHPRRRNH